MERSRFANYLISQFRVLVFKEAPRLIFSGLTKTIGSPRDLEKNLEDSKYFESAIDISIPQGETNELKAKPVPVVVTTSAAAASVVIVPPKNEEQKVQNPEIKQKIN
jgi:hypothetical protein